MFTNTQILVFSKPLSESEREVEGFDDLCEGLRNPTITSTHKMSRRRKSKRDKTLFMKFIKFSIALDFFGNDLASYTTTPTKRPS